VPVAAAAGADFTSYAVIEGTIREDACRFGYPVPDAKPKSDGPNHAQIVKSNCRGQWSGWRLRIAANRAA